MHRGGVSCDQLEDERDNCINDVNSDGKVYPSSPGLFGPAYSGLYDQDNFGIKNDHSVVIKFIGTENGDS